MRSHSAGGCLHSALLLVVAVAVLLTYLSHKVLSRTHAHSNIDTSTCGCAKFNAPVRTFIDRDNSNGKKQTTPTPTANKYYKNIRILGRLANALTLVIDM